jgi:hypothetical protein
MAQISHVRTTAFILTFAMALASFGSIVPARADDDGQAPPSVARISVVVGDAGVKHGDSDSVAAAVNAPLETGDYVSTGDDGRLEVQLDANNFVRAAADSQLRFTQLDGSGDTVQLAQGTVEVRVLQEDPDRVTVQTPSVDVVPDEAGAYLVTVDGNGMTQVTARSGSADINTPKGSQTLEPGRTMDVTGAATDPQYQFIDQVADTDFDQWADSRDQVLVAAANAPQYTNPDMMGTQDLDQYGQWNNVSGYGEVWQPSDVPAGWTPYSQGQWVYENYYGPTWVAAEPWGWAPYHYGSWAYLSIGWAWVPGPASVAPIYSPARVAFFGFGGGGVSVGVGIGARIGWVPLAPGESAHPWWGNGYTNVSNTYSNTTVQRLQYNRYTTINNYRNAQHGLVGMPVTGWQHGSFNQISRLNPQSATNPVPFTGRFPVAPTAANYRFTNRGVASSVHINAASRSAQSWHASPQSSQPLHTMASPSWQRFGSNTPRAMTPRTTSNGWQHFASAGAPRTPQASAVPRYSQQANYQRYNQQQPFQPRSQPTYAQQRPVQSYQPRTQQQSYQPRTQQQSYQPRTQQQSYQPRYQQSYQPRYQQSYQPRYQQSYQPRQQSYQPRPAQYAPRPAVSRGSDGSRPSRPHGPGTM